MADVTVEESTGGLLSPGPRASLAKGTGTVQPSPNKPDGPRLIDRRSTGGGGISCRTGPAVSGFPPVRAPVESPMGRCLSGSTTSWSSSVSAMRLYPRYASSITLTPAIPGAPWERTRPTYTLRVAAIHEPQINAFTDIDTALVGYHEHPQAGVIWIRKSRLRGGVPLISGR
ncbi:uncharacterized protein PGTG_17951 [Puccinia graminis f. sp. tritici CRL 75-36-700-3]|uniref:Uncharacterized protein n=1 Tax=Puccinia graminis f. sp. tritici (strain CRL 75-36-700-3 / race SCCL) TaxID=418459 RepID=E3L5U9_PUCGT|nr:uncharacterized protein PGTG_17951 [Puccinia graminis f. sp. tritici CRL 75-36-700-3]EFP91924.1 hypothetical protein PGTG_17951 [Puccinia graminis f. sp. tritici CRL 75-36-700-3]